MANLSSASAACSTTAACGMFDQPVCYHLLHATTSPLQGSLPLLPNLAACLSGAAPRPQFLLLASDDAYMAQLGERLDNLFGEGSVLAAVAAAVQLPLQQRVATPVEGGIPGLGEDSGGWVLALASTASLQLTTAHVG